MTGKVLLLDDDAQFCSTVTRALKGVGLQVTAVQRGIDATELLNGGGDPDVIIVDGLLPDTNGVIWIEALRNAGDDRPIVFVSAFYRDLTTFRHLTRDLGVSRVYHKPLSMDRFAREVAQLIPDTGDGDEKPLSQPHLRLVTPQETETVIYPDQVDERAQSAAPDPATSRRELPENVHALVRAVERVQAERERPSLVDEALRTVDKLQKTASALEDEEITTAIAAVEHQLRRLKSAGTADWKNITQSVGALERQVRDPADPGRRVLAAAPPVVTPAAARLLTHDVPETVVPTLLVLEDDPAMVAYLRAAFEDLLVHVRTSHTADDALRAAVEATPSAVLIGWPLQDETAVSTFLAGFRGVRGYEACRVIMLSIDDSIALRQRAATWGVDVFISQPVDLSRLRYAVEIALQSSHRQGPSILVVGDAEAADELESAGFSVYRTADLDDAVNTLRVEAVPVVLIGSGVDEVTIPAVLRMSAWDVDFSMVAFHGSPIAKAMQIDEVLDRDGGWLVAVHRLAQHALERRGWCLRCSATGLVQRGGALAAVESGLAYAQRHGRTYGAALLRAVGLEELDPNISYAVNARLGRTLSARFRREDVRARWDDATFMVGIEGSDSRSLAEVIRRFQDEVVLQLRHDGFDFDHLRLAAGLATYPLDGDTVRSLVLTAYDRLQEDLK